MDGLGTRIVQQYFFVFVHLTITLNQHALFHPLILMQNIRMSFHPLKELAKAWTHHRLN